MMIVFVRKIKCFFVILSIRKYHKEMTVFDASSSLYKWFAVRDSFNMKEHFMSLVPITETPNEDKAAILCGLKKWEEIKMIQRSGDYWILNKKLSSLDQTVSISAETALVISSITSKYAEIINNTSYFCDPFNINEKDVHVLLELCRELIKSEK